ncbi:MAG: hypothetical protein GY909_02925 [Oligoflexia bacterium]|nr:hypothetical protein [Oligoflexia bacterium]
MLFDRILNVKGVRTLPLKFILLAILTNLLFGCGIGDKDPEDLGVFDIGELGSGCQLNTEKLAKILDEDISEDINCLESNINQFTDFVRRENENFISRTELQKFIIRFFPNQAELAQDLLKLVFDLNSLLLRDPQDNISVKKIKDVFNLFRLANKDGRSLFQVLKGLNEENYWSRRQAIFYEIDRLAQGILAFTRKQDSFQQNLDIISFIESIKLALELNDDQLNPELIKSFLFVKKLLIGGNTSTVTSVEIEELLEKSSDLVLLGMDVFFAGGKKFINKDDEHFFYYDVVKEAITYFHPWEGTEHILDHNDLLKVLNEFLKDDYNVYNMEESIKKIKVNLIGGDFSSYRYRDLYKLAQWGLEFTGMLYFNDVTFGHYKLEMSSPNAINDLKIPNLEPYYVFSKTLVKKFWEQFEYISLNYRYFHDDDGLAHFFNDYKRFQKGFNTTSMLRWAIKKVVNTYGHFPNGNAGRKEVDMDDFRRLLNDVEGLVRELGIWPNDVERFISEMVNSSDLFQFHADGNKTASTEEITEYATNVLSAVELTGRIHEKLAKRCPIVDEEKESFEVSCYREFFLHIFFDELNLANYYDKLNDYVNMNGREEAQQYLINIELYARINPDENVPLTKEDLTRLVVTLTNIESIFIKNDINKNGILERNELDNAFRTFKNLIITVSKINGAPNSIYKSIFLYLIKNMEVPSALQLVSFHVFGKKKNITGTRFNISAILSSFVLQ